MHTSYIHTYINTCIHTYINSFILTTFIHTYIYKVKIETFYGKPSLGSNHRLLRLRTTKTRCSTTEPSTNPKKFVSRTVLSIRVPFKVSGFHPVFPLSFLFKILFNYNAINASVNM